MKIQGDRTQGLVGHQKSTKTSNGAAAATSAGQAGRSESAAVVEIGSAASGAKAAASRMQAGIAERIGEIRSQLASGTYKINVHKLAENLVNDELGRAGEDS